MIVFSKYTGAGNDFLLIDNRRSVFPAENAALIKQLCHRHNGVGADGILLLENTAHADYGFRIFNADGSEADMCGNGLRCLVRYICDEVDRRRTHTVIATRSGPVMGTLVEEGIMLALTPPTEMRWDLHLESEGQTYRADYLHVGVPHLVLFYDDLTRVDCLTIGRKLRSHPTLQPAGANVNFASLDSVGRVHLRTYERGVEGLTLACGSGSLATALAASRRFHLQGAIQIIPLSGDILRIAFRRAAEAFQDIRVTGPARRVFGGIVPN